MLSSEWKTGYALCLAWSVLPKEIVVVRRMYAAKIQNLCDCELTVENISRM